MEHIYLKKVIEGDSEAFRFFIKNYQDMAFTLALSVIKDEFYAEEIAQDAFMKAFNGLKTFNQQSKFKTWFYRIVINEAFMKLKKVKKEIVTYMPEENILSMKDNQPVLSQDDEQKHLIQEALKRLPSKESLALSLFYMEGYNLKEVGNLTGWSLSNTKVILFRARNNIRKILSAKMSSTFKDQPL